MKNNIGKDGDGFDYATETAPIPRYPGLEPVNRVKWGRFVRGEARTLFAEVAGSEDGSKQTQAEAFILETVPDREGMLSRNLEETASETQGISKATLRRARENLIRQGRLITRKQGSGWYLFRPAIEVQNRLTTLP